MSNGLRLIVRTEKVSPTVTVIGSVKHEPALQAAPGKDGINQVLEGLFSYGTETRARIAFQEALDDIAASETGGANFSLKVLKQYFEQESNSWRTTNYTRPFLPMRSRLCAINRSS